MRVAFCLGKFCVFLCQKISNVEKSMEEGNSSSSSSNLQIVEVNPEELKHETEIKNEIPVKTEIEVPKKPTATIALPFSPFSAGMKPTPNQTIKIYHIPAANGSGSSKPPIIKGCNIVYFRIVHQIRPSTYIS